MICGKRTFSWGDPLMIQEIDSSVACFTLTVKLRLVRAEDVALTTHNGDYCVQLIVIHVEETVAFPTHHHQVHSNQGSMCEKARSSLSAGLWWKEFRALDPGWVAVDVEQARANQEGNTVEEKDVKTWLHCNSKA
jgi:hypothetical protein